MITATYPVPDPESVEIRIGDQVRYPIGKEATGTGVVRWITEPRRLWAHVFTGTRADGSEVIGAFRVHLLARTGRRVDPVPDYQLPCGCVLGPDGRDVVRCRKHPAPGTTGLRV